MKDTLGKDNKSISIVLIIAGIFAYGIILLIMTTIYPILLSNVCRSDWDWFSDTYIPLYIYGELTGVLAIIAITIYEKICVRIGKGNSFCRENANGLHRIFYLLLSISVMYFVGPLLFPKIGVIGIYVEALALAMLCVSVLVWALGRLVNHAVTIKEENDLVI